MPTYFAIISTPTTAGRLANLSQVLATKEAYSVDAAARTATQLTGEVHWNNLFTGCYMVSISDETDGLSVVFRLLVHEDDQADFADCAALHMREIEASVAALPTVSQIWAGITSAARNLIAAAVWVYSGGRTITNTGKVTVASALNAAGDEMIVIPGEDYYAVDDRGFSWSSSDWADLTGATVVFQCDDLEDQPMEVTNAGEETKTVGMDLGNVLTSKINKEEQNFKIWVTKGGHSWSLKKGVLKKG